MVNEDTMINQKNILVIGSGARENCLAWKLSLEPIVNQVFVSPGNGGTSNLGPKINSTEIIISKSDNFTQTCDFVQKNKIELVVVGPEQYLCDGITDAFNKCGILCFGPTSSAAILEGSKAFSKYFMERNSIPTANFKVFHGLDMIEESINYVKETWETQGCVIKASGLASGKGVIVPQSLEEAITAVEDNLKNEIHGIASREIIIEQKLYGEEVSVLVLCNGDDFIPLPPSHDYKRLLNGDNGPNTGGMGSVCPTSRISHETYNQILKNIVRPTINALKNEKRPFIGCLYTGIMLTKQGPKVLEYNVRFGDPETQSILPCIKNNFYSMLIACSKGLPISHFTTETSLYTVSVVISSEGYPSNPITGIEIPGINEFKTQKNVYIFHAGTKKDKNVLKTSGGRVLTITASCDSLNQCKELVYTTINQLKWKGSHFRTDIAKEN